MQYLKISLFYAAPTVVKMVVGLAVIKIIAVNLGGDGLGQLSQLMALMTMLTVLSCGGISAGISKNVAEKIGEPEVLKTYIQTASAIVLLAIAGCAAALLIFKSALSQLLFGAGGRYSDVVALLAFAQALIGAGGALLGLLNGTKDYKAYAAVSIASILAGAFGLIFSIHTWGLVGAIYGIIWQFSCQFFFLMAWYKKKRCFTWQYVCPRWNRVAVSEYMKFAAMQFVSVCTMQIAAIVMRRILESKTDWASVGYWQGLNRVSDVLLQFVTIFLASYFLPKIAETKKKGEIKTEVARVYKFILPLYLIAIIFVLFFKREIILLLFTEEFLVLEEMFFWQLLGDLFKVIAYVAGYVAIAKAAVRTYILADCVQAGLLLGAFYLLVSTFGLYGAVYSYALVYFIYSIIALIVLRVYWGR